MLLKSCATFKIYFKSLTYCLKLTLYLTNNLSKAHVTRDSSGTATSAISVGLQQILKILKYLERVLKFEATIQKTP